MARLRFRRPSSVADSGSVAAPEPVLGRPGAARQESPRGKRDTSPISGTNRVKGVIHVPAERGEEGARGSSSDEVRMTNCQTGTVQRLGAELFFLVVAGQEDLAVLVEVVDQTFDGVGGGRAHCGKRIDIRRVKSSRRSQRSEARSQSAECRKRDEDRRERKSSRRKAHAGATGAGVSNGRGLRTGGKFTPCIQARGTRKPPNLLNNQALGRLSETPLRRPLRSSLSCCPSCPPRRSPRCSTRCSAGYSDRCGLSCRPRCSPRSSDHCGLSCRPRCSACCSRNCPPECGPRSLQGSSGRSPTSR